MSWWVDEFISFLVHELTSWQVDEFVSWWVYKFFSWRVDKFTSCQVQDFSKACEQRRYLHIIERLLHYFSAFISMFQQRQLSNHATSPADSSNTTCRIMQPHLPTCVTSAADSCNTTCQLMQRNLPTHATSSVDLCDASCRLKISPDDLFPSEKTLQNVDVGDLTRASSSYYWYYRYYWYYWYIRNGVWLSTS